MGWLDRAHTFPKGQVARNFFEALATLAVDPWQPAVAGGRHACELCVFTGGPASITVGDPTILIGSSNIFVPADGVVYVAPSLVLHYIDAHEYLPPEPFQRAVMACPPMRSMDYLRAIGRHDLHKPRPHGTR